MSAFILFTQFYSDIPFCGTYCPSDEERQFDEGDDTSANFQQWEEFAVIAADFVEKIESFLEKSRKDANNHWPPNTNTTGTGIDKSHSQRPSLTSYFY